MKTKTPIYLYNNEEVVLAYADEVIGKNPIAVGNDIGVYSAEIFPFSEVTPRLTLDDCYSSYTEPEEIEFGEIINPENEDGVILGWLRMSEYLRQKALIEIKNMPKSWFEQLMIDEHSTHRFRVCVYPDGEVVKHEDMSTTDYTTNVEVVYSVGGVYCNCDTCKMYRDLDELNEDDFIELYDKKTCDYCNETTIEQAIIDCNYNNGITAKTIKDEIIEAINNIDADFFKV